MGKERRVMDEIVIALMSGPQDGAVLTFEAALDSGQPTELTIGRREGCDVCLSYDSQVSREHARLTYDGETFWLEDLDSTNGSYVDDIRIKERTEVQAGQLFRIGRTWLRVEPIARFTPFHDFDDDNDLPF
jgi:pSer/pThr/pTyr-binding forkhead associated (FHA) protein